MKLETVAIASLKPDPDNARTHPESNLDAIRYSLEKFGQQRPILVGKDNVVVAGNGTLAAASSLGWDKIKVVRTELLGQDKTAYALVDNRSALMAEWDDGKLGETLHSLQEDGWELPKLGFDPDAFFAPEKTGLTDDDAVPEVKETSVKRGEIYQLGDHRVMCGDSTSKDDVSRLMAGEKADMVFTDPPYGLGGYKGRGKESSKEVGGDREDPIKFYQNIPDAAEIYVWGGFKNLRHISFEPDDVIVWRKNNFGMGRGYRGQYEICMYTGSFSGSDSDVWDVPKDIDYQHPTQKPVALCERAIKNSNPKLVVDTYLGSGSTLIACEKTNRKCYGMEIDPHYCQVIIDRWQNFSGKKANKIA